MSPGEACSCIMLGQVAEKEKFRRVHTPVSQLSLQYCSNSFKGGYWGAKPGPKESVISFIVVMYSGDLSIAGEYMTL